MTYDFASLSHADFEDLSRDLVGEYLAIRFEAFAAGPDQGMDGRHAKGPAKIILQAKHLAGSKFADLKRAMKKERAAIDRLAPSRYVLTTSCKLTPPNKAELAEIIGPSLKSEDDILGPGDLNEQRHASGHRLCYRVEIGDVDGRYCCGADVGGRGLKPRPVDIP